MDARICANPACRTIQPGWQCGLCNTLTAPLPKISLGVIGVDGTVHLTHTPGNGYVLLVKLPSSQRHVHVTLSDLLHSSQPHLPNVYEAGGLLIMDTLQSAARLIRTKNTGHWAGWIAYLIDVLQGYADTATFQEVLEDLRQEIAHSIAQHEPLQEQP